MIKILNCKYRSFLQIYKYFILHLYNFYNYYKLLKFYCYEI